jgi:heptosyltransferase-3
LPRHESPTSLLPALPPGARILILRLRSIGDVVLLTPALRLLKRWRPDLMISVVVESRFRELLEATADVDEILEPGSGSGPAKLRARIAAVREIRKRQFSLCVNLHGGPTSAFLARWSGARWKAGFEHFRRRGIYQALIPDARLILNQPRIHTAEHQASAFFYLGLPREEIPPACLAVGPAAEAWWDKERASLGVPQGQEYAVLHPTALYFTKQWAPEHFAALGEYLERQKSLRVVYTCGPGEATILDKVQQAAGATIRRLEGPRLGDFLATLAGARLFVGNDSGPAHMAAALGRPGVVIFGSSSSSIWGPWRPRAPWRVVQNPYDCNPCPGDRCYRYERPECILSVTLEQVRSAVEEILTQTSPDSV